MWKEKLEKAVEIARSEVDVYAETGDEWYEMIGDFYKHLNQTEKHFDELLSEVKAQKERKDILDKATQVCSEVGNSYKNRTGHLCFLGDPVTIGDSFLKLAKKYKENTL